METASIWTIGVLLEYGILADHLAVQRVDRKEMTPLVWGRRITRRHFIIGVRQWKQRNTDGHLLTHQKESSLIQTGLLQRISQFQSIVHDIPHRYRDFLYREMVPLGGYLNSNLCSWLKLAENLVCASKLRRGTNVDISQYIRSQPNVPSSVDVK
jgi:hypothetical protein